ncbi:MAG: hypothetical protein EXR79_11285 [Myxococcales bacterium]|nr:hypothetical protein [Myxococcales bacterium]
MAANGAGGKGAAMATEGAGQGGGMSSGGGSGTTCKTDKDCKNGQVCTKSGFAKACGPKGGSCVGAAEVCNGKDDDCDGQVDEGSPCSDGNACNGAESCQAGACVAGAPPACADADACTLDSCDPAKGCQYKLLAGATCDDGNACTGCSLPAGVQSMYAATVAANCPEEKWVGCNALWLPGFYDGIDKHIARFDIAPGARLDWNADGTAHLHGRVTSYHVTGGPQTLGEAWDLSIGLQYRGQGAAGVGSGGPKLDDGWVVPKSITDTWHYFDMIPGKATLQKVGGGGAVAMTQKPAGSVFPFQIGKGANGKTMAFGSSAWFDYVKTTPDGVIQGHGDVNVDLEKLNIPDDCDTCKEGTCAPGSKKSCDDKNGCTVDACDAKTGTCSNAPQDAASCDDGLVCTTGDACKGAYCQGGPADDKACDDGEPCTKDKCTHGIGCQNQGALPHVPCDDGNACTAGDECFGKKCKGKEPTGCDDQNPCTVDSCDDSAGCQHAPVDAPESGAGVPCEDGDVCTSGEACVGAACKGGTPTSCDDQNACTVDACNKLTGCTHTAKAGACDDGNACTQGDACGKGQCVPGASAVCDDGSPCTKDSCDFKQGCLHAPLDGKCDDSSQCTSGETCQGGACGGGALVNCDDGNPCSQDSCLAALGCMHEGLSGSACEDGDACTQQDACAAGKCKAGSATACDDGSACTADTCNPAKGCVFVPLDGKPCNDGNACTPADVCNGGACVGGGATDCHDGNPCTTDACDAKKGCFAVSADGKPCNDKNACTSGDLCKAGSCVAAGKIDCDDGNACTGEACEPKKGCVITHLDGKACNDNNACTTEDACKAGQCTGKTPMACSDGNPCTTDSCEVKGGCKFVPADGAPCSDGTACTVGDSCHASACKPGGAAECDDGNPCTADACDAKAGCTNKNSDGKPCSDDDACTADDTCQGGACGGKFPASCDDKNACTTDGCDKQGGCWHKPKDGAACSDGNACTGADVCLWSKCVAGAAVVCNDGNPCTADACTADTGCGAVPIGGACDDGNACTQGDSCGGGACKGGSAPACDDGNACTADTCDANAGCQHADKNGAACVDGNPCTANDTCQGGQCNGGKVNCDDGNPCTVDGCDKASGCTHEGLTAGAGSIDIVSDAATSAGGKPSVATWSFHKSWTAQVPGATWIWSEVLVSNPAVDAVVTFERSFNVSPAAEGLQGTLVVAADNSYVCTLNGVKVGEDATEFNYFESSKDTWALGTALQPGANKLVCTVKNWAQWWGTAYTNPAGLLYRLQAQWTAKVPCSDGNGCTVGDVCQAGACKPGALKTCNDDNVCSADSCDPGSGQCLAKPLSGQPCNDGNPCTGVCLKPGVSASYELSGATGSGGHGFWLPGFSGAGTERMVFNQDARFDVLAGKGHMYGTATVFDAGGGCCVGDEWKFDFWFAYRGQGPAGQGSGGPKYGVIKTVPKAVTDTWKYFDMIPGQATMVRVGNPKEWAAIGQAPADSMFPFQLGLGANYFSMVLGASSWLVYERHAESGKVWGGKGDVNIDMTPANPPATCDACQNGQCTGGKVSCDDGNPCTLDACNPANGQCSHTKIPGCDC